MTDPHEVSKAVHAIEGENLVMSHVIDRLFNEKKLSQRDKNELAGIMHRKNLLTDHSIAKQLVVLYAQKVKPARDTETGRRDTSRTQAVRNAENLLEGGMSYERLASAVTAAGKYYNETNANWEHRMNCGNFFGQRKGYAEFLPEIDTSVPNAEQAKKVDGLFDEREE